MKRVYTEQQKAETIKLIRDGMSLKEIHANSGIPIGTISRWASQLGISYRRDPAELRDQISSFLEGKENVPLAQVAKTFRTCQGRVREIFEKLGKESPKCRARRLRPQGVEMLREGKYPVEISRLLGVSVQTISAWKAQIGLTTPQKRHLLPEETKLRVLRMYWNGSKLAEIHKEVGVSIPTIRKWIGGAPDVVRPRMSEPPATPPRNPTKFF